MRICFLTTEYARYTPTGGIGNYIQDTSRGMVELGHQIDVIVVDGSPEMEDEDDNGVNIHRVRPRSIPVRPLLSALSHLPGLSTLREVYCGWGLLEASLGGWLAIRRLENEQGRFDLIEASDFGAIAFWPLFLDHRMMKRLLLRGHSLFDSKSKARNWCGANFHHQLERYCARRARIILVNSCFLQRGYLSVHGADADRIAVLPYGLRSYHSDGFVAESRPDLNWFKDHTIILYVGRIEYQKGCDLLFNVLLGAHDIHPNIRAVLVGSVTSTFQPVFERFMEQAESWVYHTGSIPTEEVGAWMEVADVLVHVSREETFGRVVAEAQMHGLPVIVSNVDALPELVEDQLTGFIVELDDAESLTNVILHICMNQELRIAMGKYGREQALNQFDFNRVLDRQLQVYKKIVIGESVDSALTRAS